MPKLIIFIFIIYPVTLLADIYIRTAPSKYELFEANTGFCKEVEISAVVAPGPLGQYGYLQARYTYKGNNLSYKNWNSSKYKFKFPVGNPVEESRLFTDFKYTNFDIMNSGVENLIFLERKPSPNGLSYNELYVLPKDSIKITTPLFIDYDFFKTWKGIKIASFGKYDFWYSSIDLTTIEETNYLLMASHLSTDGVTPNDVVIAKIKNNIIPEKENYDIDIQCRYKLNET